MIELRRFSTLGSANHGWLDTRFSFSFAGYWDPDHMGFRALRVINEDRIAPGQGFGTHPHRDMEIVTYIINGAIEHKDSMGNGTVIRAGEVQRMTAGTGVQHSEFNHSPEEELHLLQIWIFPEAKNLEPGYEQKLFSQEQKHNRLCLIASRDGRDGSLTIHQDVDLYASIIDTGERVSLADVEGRRVFVQVVSGKLEVNGKQLAAGDGMKIQNESSVELEALDRAEFLLFNLA